MLGPWEHTLVRRLEVTSAPFKVTVLSLAVPRIETGSGHSSGCFCLLDDCYFPSLLMGIDCGECKQTGISAGMHICVPGILGW